MTPQSRSRHNLTERGYLVAAVETRKQFPDKKKHPCKACGHQPQISVSLDLFNCFDLLAIHPGKKETLYVQVTSAANHATRRNKVLSSFETKLVLMAGGRVLIQSWRVEGQTRRWVAREEEITLDDFRQAPNYPNSVRELVEIRRKAKKPDLPPGSDLNFCAGAVDFSNVPF